MHCKVLFDRNYYKWFINKELSKNMNIKIVKLITIKDTLPFVPVKIFPLASDTLIL